MAANCYCPSTSRKSERKRIWSVYDLKPAERNSSVSSFGYHAGDAQRFTSQQAESAAAWRPRGLLEAPEYEPLAFFCRPTDDCGPASCNVPDIICELSILLKELELSKMMEEPPDIQEKVVLMTPPKGPSVPSQRFLPVRPCVHSSPVMTMPPVQLAPCFPRCHFHWYWQRLPVCPHPMVTWQPMQVSPHLLPVVRWNYLHLPMSPNLLKLV